MSVWLGACGEERPAALTDYDTADRMRSGSTEGAAGRGTSPPEDPVQTGAAGSTGSTPAGTGGTIGSYIPTPVETGPTEPEPPGPTGQAGSGSTSPVEPCSQGTWPGNFSARSTAELQQIIGYTHVAGTLYVGVNSSDTTTDITSLAPLSCMEEVDGDVTILENHYLLDLDGLERLALVGRNFTVSTNAQIATLAALDQVVIAEVLHIRANPQLTTLGDGFLSAGVMYINENPALPQCLAQALASDLGLTCNCENNAESDSCP